VKATYKGKEVTNPVAKVLIIIFLIFVAMPLALSVSMLLIASLIVLSPILIPLHLILRKSGRQGFVRDGGRRIVIGSGAFRKRGS